MASTVALWFPVEAAFAEIERLCVEARAAELAVQQKRDDAQFLRAAMSGRSPVKEPAPVPSGTARDARASELSKDLAFREAHANGADFVEMRAHIRKQIGWLKTSLAEALTEHEVYYALFPLVVYTDELVASIAPGQGSRWEPLQSELYEIDNGGELFYGILDDQLRKDETPPIVFEIFYFCLRDGFLGAYQNDRKKIEEYMAKLVARVSLRDTDEATLIEGEPQAVELARFPWQFYVFGVCAVAAGWLVLGWMASSTSL